MNPTHLQVQHHLLTVVAILVLANSGPGADEPKPTRDAFLNEVLDAKPTPITPKFNDYTPGSYHVEKEDLLKGLTDEAKKRKLTLRAVTILGPLPGDPLWTSYVAVFIQEGEKVRVNSLVMPHARITTKSSGLITSERYAKWLQGILDVGILRKATDGEEKKENQNPFASEILLVTWSEDGKSREVLHESVGQDEKVEKLFEQYNGVLKELKRTYPEKSE